MYKIVGSSEFIDLIRSLDPRLNKARISNIEIDKGKTEIKYNFICDQTVDKELENLVLAEVEKITPPVFSSICVSIKKIVSDDELINHEIFKYLNANYPSISLFLKTTDINSKVFGDVVKYTLRLTADGVDYVNKNGAINKLSAYLATKFCSDFAGTTKVKEAEETVSLLKEEVFESQIQRIEMRTIKVSNVEVIDDSVLGDVAIYIEDALSGDVTVCGTIKEIKERETKTGKPMFSLKIDDTTGFMRGLYFTKKATLNKIRELKEGDDIIARVSIGEYNGAPSYTFGKINKCVFPKDFVKKEKFKKKAPIEYKVIFPTKAETVKVNSVFEKELPIPTEVLNSVYVVFDVETTGKSPANDEITEIGAVKIENGKITEQFQTLIKPNYPIPQEIVELTGISDDLVKDAPKISSIIPDFMKFIDGTILIGHNVGFDLGFIKKFASAEEYNVNNKYLDTMDLMLEYVPEIKTRKLENLCEHFGIIFHHHRALADAYGTAEAFLEMMKIKKQNE